MESTTSLIDPNDVKAVLAASAAIRRERTLTRRNRRLDAIQSTLAKNKPLDGSLGKFAVLYADPPWRYGSCRSDSRAVENHYPTMTLDEICRLDIATITHDDAVLFLWATSPKAEEAFRVVNAWGFRYKTQAVWDKEKIGMGYYFRQRHEILLVATKGNIPVPLPRDRPDSIFRSPRQKHSRKPEIVYEIIEKMYPHLPKIELFARSARSGWSVWGNQS